MLPRFFPHGPENTGQAHAILRPHKSAISLEAFTRRPYPTVLLLADLAPKSGRGCVHAYPLSLTNGKGAARLSVGSSASGIAFLRLGALGALAILGEISLLGAAAGAYQLAAA